MSLKEFRPSLRYTKNDISLSRASSFRKTFGEGHYKLACHASVSVALNPDLLYSIREQFIPDVPWFAVSDVLLSSLCYFIENDQYEMDDGIRDNLIQDLLKDKNFGAKRIIQVSLFILEYLERTKFYNSSEAYNLIQDQRALVYAYIRPERAAIDIATRFSELDLDDYENIIKTANFAEALAKPLVKFPSLLNYSHGMVSSIRGDEDNARKYFLLAKDEVKSTSNPTSLLISRLSILQLNRQITLSYFHNVLVKKENINQILDFLQSLPSSYTSNDQEELFHCFKFVGEQIALKSFLKSFDFKEAIEIVKIISEEVPSINFLIASIIYLIFDHLNININFQSIEQNFNRETALFTDRASLLISLSRKIDISNRKYDLIKNAFLTTIEKRDEILILLATNLNKLRKYKTERQEDRIAFAYGILGIYAPLAKLLGFLKLNIELEDLAFSITRPDLYAEILELLGLSWTEREHQIDSIAKNIELICAQESMNVKVIWKLRSVYSLYEQKKASRISLSELMDLREIRIIVNDITSCYTVSSIVTMHWRPISNLFHDYISNPLEPHSIQFIDNYVYYDDGKPVQIQIMTNEMFKTHAFYKNEMLPKIIKEYEGLSEENSDFLDFLRYTNKTSKDRIFVFSIDRTLIELPEGSTPIDFAYYLGTDIGHRCRGAKINGRLATLDFHLKTGDVVEIVTARKGGPSRDWLNPYLKLVNTSYALQRIKAWFKNQDKESNRTKGKKLLDSLLNKFKGTSDPINTKTLISMFEVENIDDLYILIGSGDLSINSITEKLNNIFFPDRAEPLLLSSKPKKKTRKHFFEENDPLQSGRNEFREIIDLEGLKYTFANCCKPVFGDEILGYVTQNRGVVIHRKNCPNIINIKDKNRLLPVSWGIRNGSFPITLEIVAYDRSGLMGDISLVLSNLSVNILDVNLKVNLGKAVLRLVIEVEDISKFAKIISLIKEIPNVDSVYRVNPS